MIRDISQTLTPSVVRAGRWSAPVLPLLLAGPWLFNDASWVAGAWLLLFGWLAVRARANLRATAMLVTTGIAGASALLLPAGPWTILAALVATGAVPFHLWMEGARRSLVSSEFELLLVAQPTVAWMHCFAEEHPGLLDGTTGYVLVRFFVVSAVVHAGLSLVRPGATRAVASIVLAQTSLVLAGAAAGGVGWGGARAMLLSTAVGATVLLSVLDERRDAAAVDTESALHRLFLAAGWLMVGMPGGLAFFAEDLLFHGLLEHSTLVTMFFVGASGLTVIGFFRTYVDVFTGPVRTPAAVVVADPARTVRLGVLTGMVLLMVLGGLFPGPLTH